MKRACSILFLVILTTTGHSQTYKGTIIRVIDGDTYVFQTAEGSLKVRMFGIDAPEKDQPFSRESSEFMRRYLNKEAILKAHGIDKYGRTLGTIFINGQDINLLSVKAGYSWHFKRYSSDINYAQAEEYAKKNKLGLWALPNPIPPWEWRKMK